MENIKVYRIENPNTRAGMWYNADATPSGIIHSLTQGKCANLPMDFDSKYRKDGFEWFSAGSGIENMNQWFSALDAYELQQKGYQLYEFIVSQYIVDEHQAYFTREGVVSQRIIPLSEVFDIGGLFKSDWTNRVQVILGDKDDPKNQAKDPLDENSMTEKEFLKNYKVSDYERPSVTVDIVIFGIKDTPNDNIRRASEKQLQVLLVKRKGHPFLGKWALPGGFVNPQETVGEAARRELLEETGIPTAYLEQLATFSTPGRDPRTWVITVAHMALVNVEDVVPVAGSDADEVKWFDVEETDAFREDGILFLSEDGEFVTDLAFDHNEIVIDALSRLKSKLEWTDIALSLMPKQFSLAELQRIYETILDVQLYPQVFRKSIERWVEETDDFERGGARRPARLYKRKYNKIGVDTL